MTSQTEGTFEDDALSSLKEAADLVALVEDLMHPASLQALSPIRASGMRLTLKNVKRNILELHEALRAKQSERPLHARVEKERQLPEEREPVIPNRRRVLQSPISMSVTTTDDFTQYGFPTPTNVQDDTL